MRNTFQSIQRDSFWCINISIRIYQFNQSYQKSHKQNETSKSEQIIHTSRKTEQNDCEFCPKTGQRAILCEPQKVRNSFQSICFFTKVVQLEKTYKMSLFVTLQDKIDFFIVRLWGPRPRPQTLLKGGSKHYPIEKIL